MKKFLPIIFLVSLLGCGGGVNDGGSNTGSGTGGGSPPGAYNTAVTAITDSSAVLTGTVYPNRLATSCWFDYGTDNSFATFTSTAKQSVGSNVDSVIITSPINGLSGGTVYYYRLNASSSAGAFTSPILNFSTFSSGPPTVVTKAATSVTPSGAVLNGTVRPNGFATTAWFEWGTNSNLDTYSLSAEHSVGAGYDDTLDNTTLTGLSAGTTYYYRVAASNSSGTMKGTILSFIPSSAPAVTTLAATSISASGAVLNGEVNPNGLNTEAWFRFGTDPNLGPYTGVYYAFSQYLGPSDTGQLVNADISWMRLKTGTTYYFKVSAVNISGNSEGTILSFTTVASAPEIISEWYTLPFPANGTATLYGAIDVLGLEATAWFEWGTDSNLDTYSKTAEQSIGPNIYTPSIDATLTGLSSGTTYYFRIAASNKFGTSKGTISSFTP